jgi:hypothetical protein
MEAAGVKRLLVIPLQLNDVTEDNDTDNIKEVSPTSEKVDNLEKKRPILSHLTSRLRLGRNDDEKFQIDMSMRPDDISIKSEAYQSIPIEEFGAAMLRGMDPNWHGPSKDDDERLAKLDPKKMSRDNRLGLGALAKPPDKKFLKSNERSKELEREWSAKVFFFLMFYLTLPLASI